MTLRIREARQEVITPLRERNNEGLDQVVRKDEEDKMQNK